MVAAAKSAGSAQRVPEAERMAQALGEQHQPGHAGLLQARQHLAGERAREHPLDERVAGDQQRRLQRLQARDALQVPRAGRDESGVECSRADQLRDALLAARRVAGLPPARRS